MDWQMRVATTLALATTLPAVLPAQAAELVLLAPTGDTIAWERLQRSDSRLEAVLLAPPLGVRFVFTIELGPDGTARQMTNRFWQPSDPEDAPPRQEAVLRFAGDSVFVEIPDRPVRPLGTQPGAVPYLNPSFAIMELVLAQAAREGADSARVPMFMVQGGQTLPYLVTRPHPDSAVVSMLGTEARLRVTADHQILGGMVPSQGLRIVRRPPTRASFTTAPPDYSAPPGAPYTAREVRVPTPAGHVLAGTLTLPAGASASRPVPAVITATGSGLQDRDEAIPGVPGYRPFRQLADTLSRHGIAVLRLDDRGFGASTGNGATATSADFADDLRAGIAWLRAQPEIDGGRVAIVGHSEGGLTAPMVAATDSALAGLVLLAGPSRTGREIIAYQQEGAFARTEGLTATQRDSMLTAARQALDSASRVNPWIRYFMDHDPLPVARQVRHTPVFIVQGATDLQILADQAPELRDAFLAGGNPDVTMTIYEDANHLLIQDPDGDPAGYGRLPHRAVRTDILADVLAWLTQRLRP